MVSLFAVDRGDLLYWLLTVGLYVLVTVCACVCLWLLHMLIHLREDIYDYIIILCLYTPFETLLYTVVFFFLYTCIQY